MPCLQYGSLEIKNLLQISSVIQAGLLTKMGLRLGEKALVIGITQSPEFYRMIFDSPSVRICFQFSRLIPIGSAKKSQAG